MAIEGLQRRNIILCFSLPYSKGIPLKYTFSVSGKKAESAQYNVHFIKEIKDIDKSSFPTEVKTALKAQVDKKGFENKNGQIISFEVLVGKEVKAYLMVGLGSLTDQEQMRRAAASASRFLRADKTKKYGISVSFAFDITEAHITSLVEGFRLTSYSFNKYKKTPSLPDSTVSVGVSSNLSANATSVAIKKGEVNCNAVYFAKDLINESPSELYPASLGAILKKEFKNSKVKVQVHDTTWLKKNKMGGILAVGQGSVKKPVLIEMSYKPAKAKKHIVLVGKGVTFDSGGLSIKVGGGMIWMKMDMSGAASVSGALKIISESNANVQVTVLIPSVENMPDGNAYRVDDVLQMADGSTVEVNNTDAEGRLILADALYWASKMKPDSIVDVATLTGACVVALGTWTAGMLSNNETVAGNLIAASTATGEKIARLPLDQDLSDNLKSYLADQKNTTGGGPEGGAIIAGLFLEKFVKETPWGHLDIAGTMKTPDSHLFDGGGVAFGVRLLADYSMNQA
jgi:leucyl aminopeptidase